MLLRCKIISYSKTARGDSKKNPCAGSLPIYLHRDRDICSSKTRERGLNLALKGRATTATLSLSLGGFRQIDEISSSFFAAILVPTLLSSDGISHTTRIDGRVMDFWNCDAVSSSGKL